MSDNPHYVSCDPRHGIISTVMHGMRRRPVAVLLARDAVPGAIIVRPGVTGVLGNRRPN